MEEKVINIIAKVLEVDNSEIDSDTIVGDIPEWDSLHHLMIISKLEEEFNVKFQAEELAELEDVSDLVKLVEEKI